MHRSMLGAGIIGAKVSANSRQPRGFCKFQQVFGKCRDWVTHADLLPAQAGLELVQRRPGVKMGIARGMQVLSWCSGGRGWWQEFREGCRS